MSPKTLEMGGTKLRDGIFSLKAGINTDSYRFTLIPDERSEFSTSYQGHISFNPSSPEFRTGSIQSPEILLNTIASMNCDEIVVLLGLKRVD